MFHQIPLDCLNLSILLRGQANFLRHDLPLNLMSPKQSGKAINMALAAYKNSITASKLAQWIKPKPLADREVSTNLNRLRHKIKLLIRQIFARQGGTNSKQTWITNVDPLLHGRVTKFMCDSMLNRNFSRN